jgi:precorrin-3B C17-methyltransferase
LISIVGISYRDEFRTREATETIRKADVVIGHDSFREAVSAYIRDDALSYDVLDRLQPGDDFRQERVEAALEHERRGLDVAIVSAGDPGIWGMAAYVLEYVDALPERVEVRLVPGIPAYHDAATKLGTPLMNGFAVLSLCDDLTARDVVEKRVKACASGDLVTAFYKLRYNAEFYPDLYPPETFPQFKDPVRLAKGLLSFVRSEYLKSRPGSTPVVLCNDLGMPSEEFRHAKLEELDSLFDHFKETSLLIVGNSETIHRGEYLISNR